jgi:hypothetical protein
MSPRGHHPAYPNYREAIPPPKSVIPESYPDFRDDFKITKPVESYRIEGNLTSFGSKTLPSVTLPPVTATEKIETPLATPNETPVQSRASSAREVPADTSTEDENASLDQLLNDVDDVGVDVDVDALVNAYTDEDIDAIIDILDEDNEAAMSTGKNSKDNIQLYLANDDEYDNEEDKEDDDDDNNGDSHVSGVDHGSTHILQQGSDLDQSTVDNLVEFSGGVDYTSSILEATLKDSSRLQSADNSARLLSREGSSVKLEVSSSVMAPVVLAGALHNYDLDGVEEDRWRPVKNKENDEADEKEDSSPLHFSHEANTLYSDMDSDRTGRKTPQEEKSRKNDDEEEEEETFIPFKNVPRGKPPASPIGDSKSEKSFSVTGEEFEYTTAVDSYGVEYTEHFTDEGDKYFANKLTGETTWYIDQNQNQTQNQNEVYYDHDYSTDYQHDAGHEKLSTGALNEGYGSLENVAQDDIWQALYTDDGHLYYYNTVTGDSSWTHPDEALETGTLQAHATTQGDTNDNHSSMKDYKEEEQQTDVITKPLIKSNSSRKNILEANQEADRQLEIKTTFEQRNADQFNALSRSRGKKKPEKSLLSNFPLFATSIDSIPAADLDSTDDHHPDQSSADLDAYGVINLPNFMGNSPTKKKSSTLKKKKSFKKEKKASVVKKV